MPLPQHLPGEKNQKREKEEPRLPIHNQRKLGTASALNMSLLAKLFPS